ncbi:lipid IV(A) 3-deoxy-D-manno-octulosonic acid transferase [Abyssibacter sp.]|uniref:lipid IV(A) 3-deoxy-D-manno-octulosonic acid transferase n=1 Tax=Abyssibacter sp. TaxID=2320200 RepID=UPI0035174AB1
MTRPRMDQVYTTLARWTYTALFYVAVPLILVNLLRRGRRQPAYLHRFGERFGWCRPGLMPAPVWLHAVSVGEVEAAAPLIRQLIGRYGTAPILVTCGTPTGSERIRDLFGDSVEHCYLPYDLPTSVDRFLARKQPQRAIIIEAELWPNLYAACHRRRVPLILVNARMSPGSFRAWSRVPRLARVMLGRITRILAQHPDDAARFVALGAPAERVRPSGNIKFDRELPPDLQAKTTTLREAVDWPQSAPPTLIAASVHPGEWPMVLEAFRTLRNGFATARLVLVPRHPERFRAAREAAEAEGWTVRSRSQSSGPASYDVLIGDTMGELMAMFGLGQIALVGGSLVPIGGHNVLEPAALGMPVLFGPHRQSFRAAGDALVEAGGGWEIHDASTLAAQITKLWTNTETARAAGAAAREVVRRNQGAVTRAVAAVDAIEVV